MIGFQFSKYIPTKLDGSNFDNLLDLFKQLLLYTSGDPAEAIDWMNELDKQHNVTNSEYGMGDFIQDLKDKGFLDEGEHILKIHFDNDTPINISSIKFH